MDDYIKLLLARIRWHQSAISDLRLDIAELKLSKNDCRVVSSDEINNHNDYGQS